MNSFGDAGRSLERSAAARFCCCFRNPVNCVSSAFKPFSLHFFDAELIVFIQVNSSVNLLRICRSSNFHAALVHLQETLRSERRGWGWKSLTRHHFVGPAPAAHVVQCRDSALKTRIVSVQIRPWALVAVRKDPRVAQ